MYSIKMRASVGGHTDNDGRHISGAERIVGEEQVGQTVSLMLERAKTHERGEPDFINLKIRRVDIAKAAHVRLLPVYERPSHSKEEGRQIAADELVRIGVSPAAAAIGISAVSQLRDSMRGAMIVDAVSGVRLDNLGDRGVRCSNMDIADRVGYVKKLSECGLHGAHAEEAIVLASKVASAKGTVAELCWSDDPGYVTGYVASPKFGYCRISVMKDRGDCLGGRVFFVQPDTDIQQYIDYMQNQIVLVDL